mmetsp:Transcript_2975/g.5201  ORF Transcript_2975/g.5201 Transcript_2975/m.5201 type:complete len:212 (-) Transcript_2975:1653-2288(-)
MPRTYKPKNRFCRNTKLSEDEFVEAFNAFMAGMGAAAHARNTTRSEKTIRELFARLRERLSTDMELTGWIGVGPDLPDADDPVWAELYDCMFHCPAYVDDRTYRSPTYSSEYRGTDPNGEHRQKALTFVRKKHGSDCKACPIKLDFTFDVQVREIMGKHDLRVGGIPRVNFKPHYIEIMLRSAMEIKNSKFTLPDNFGPDYFLNRFADVPL